MRPSQGVAVSLLPLTAPCSMLSLYCTVLYCSMLTLYCTVLYCSMLSLYGTTDLVPGLRRVCSRQTMGSLMPLLRTMQQDQAQVTNKTCTL